jgi:ribonucleotide reductase beta subunit family protein with ferritin-like domain
MYDLWKDAVNTFWNPEEITLKKDLQDWKLLNTDEQHYIKYTLAFFASSDNIVAENLLSRFATEIQAPEIRTFYAMQAAQESIHSVTYNMLIDALVSDSEERKRLFLAIRTHPMIKQKAEWAIKWITQDAPFAKRLIAFAIVEMVFFSSAFCSIYWVKKRGLMPGLTLSNEWISRDEALHCKAAWTIYNLLQPENRLTTKDLHALMMEAVNVESEAVRDSLPVALIGMNADSMIQYVKYCADMLLVELGAPKLFHARNPFNWMGMISAPGKTNFFERINADYLKVGGVKNNVVSSLTTHTQTENITLPSAKEEMKENAPDKPYISEDFNL